MPGCAVLLLSLVVLSMGSDARRIRKRGLNHKVRLHPRGADSVSFQSRVVCLNVSEQWGLCGAERLSHHRGTFVAEVRGS